MWTINIKLDLILQFKSHNRVGLWGRFNNLKLSLKIVFFRAETILSGVIIRPDPDDPESSVLSLMLQMDMKGWIPHFIVNAFAARAPAQWQSNLFNYYWNVYFPQQQEKERVDGAGGGKAED